MIAKLLVSQGCYHFMNQSPLLKLSARLLWLQCITANESVCYMFCRCLTNLTEQDPGHASAGQDVVVMNRNRCWLVETNNSGVFKQLSAYQDVHRQRCMHAYFISVKLPKELSQRYWKFSFIGIFWECHALRHTCSTCCDPNSSSCFSISHANIKDNTPPCLLSFYAPPNRTMCGIGELLLGTAWQSWWQLTSGSKHIARRASKVQTFWGRRTFVSVTFTECICFMKPGCSSPKMNHLGEP